MTITTQPPRLHLTGSADYAKIELAIPASAVDTETNKIDADEVLRHITLALDHDDGTPAEVVATILAWSAHLTRLEEDDRWEAFLDWEGYVLEEDAAQRLAKADQALYAEADDEDGDNPGHTHGHPAADVG
jgi:hypothetical protein